MTKTLFSGFHKSIAKWPSSTNNRFWLPHDTAE